MKVNPTIRHLTENDLNQASELFCKAFSSVNQKWDPETALKRLKQYFNVDSCWAAEMNSKVIGILTSKVDNVLDHQELYIDIIAVNPEYHKAGIGSMLLEKAEEYANSKGYKAVWLTASSEIPSFKWYLKTGFKETSWKALVKDFITTP